MESIKLRVLIFCLVILQLTLVIKSNPVEWDETKGELIRNKRWGKSAKRTHWPNGIISYKFGCTEYTEDEIDKIKVALEDIMNKTCLQFIEIDSRSHERNFINISCNLGGSCVSKLGFEGGAQHMNLARVKTLNPLQACLSKRKIQHEFLHALGFKHEHTSFNRDDYINIKYQNIEPGSEKYFAKDPENKFRPYGCEFDYNSVMMPPTRKHSKNGQPTIIPIDKSYTPRTMGIAESISECDITRINTMYCENQAQENKQVTFDDKINIIN